MVFFFFFFGSCCSECERRRYWLCRSWSQWPISAWIEANGFSWCAKAEHGLVFSEFGVYSAGPASVSAGNKWSASEATAVFLYLRAYFLKLTASLRVASAFFNSWHSSFCFLCHGCYLCSPDSRVGFEIHNTCVLLPACCIKRILKRHRKRLFLVRLEWRFLLPSFRCGFLQRHEALPHLSPRPAPSHFSRKWVKRVD